MKRDKPYDSLLAWDERSADGNPGTGNTPGNTPDQFRPDDIDHERARKLILEQSERLLPAPDANALADHLLVCDRCYRFAQEVAARERQRNSGELKHQ